MLSPIVRHFVHLPAFNSFNTCDMRICGLRRRSVHARSRRHPIFKSALVVCLFLTLCSRRSRMCSLILDATWLPAGPCRDGRTTARWAMSLQTPELCFPQVTNDCRCNRRSHLSAGPLEAPARIKSARLRLRLSRAPIALDRGVGLQSFAQGGRGGVRMGASWRAPMVRTFLWPQHGWSFGAVGHWGPARYRLGRSSSIQPLDLHRLYVGLSASQTDRSCTKTANLRTPRTGIITQHAHHTPMEVPLSVFV
jgi:hypothetical protein